LAVSGIIIDGCRFTVVQKSTCVAFARIFA